MSKNKEVESFQLQAVCQAIEEKVIHGQKQKFDPISLLPKVQGLPLITPDFYGGREGIDRILEDSYNRRLDDLANIDESWPEIAHRLIEDGLVNKNGRRKSVDVVELLAKHRATPALLEELESQRLVRKEPRLDSFYYEISHDTWLGPILKNRKIWEEAEEKRLLEARAEVERVEKEKAIAARRRAKLVAGLGLLLAGLAVGAAWYAILKSREAERQTAEAVLQTTKANSLLVEAKDSKRLADDKAAEAERNARVAELEKKKALTAQEKAELEKLKAVAARKKAEDLLIATQIISTRRMPENFDALIPLDSLNCKDWDIGVLSPEIGKLINLKKLDLQRNNLTSLPIEIGNLKNLQSLDLEHNDLTNLPIEIGNLQDLQSLDLTANHLASLPGEIGNFQNLRSLDLGQNGLARIPIEIGKLQNLQKLDLSLNELTSLPTEIGNLRNLRFLNLQGNNLTNLPIEVLKEMKKLKKLILNNGFWPNPLLNSEVETLRAAMPWCEVVWKE